MQRSAPSLASVLRNSKFCTGRDNFIVFAECFGNGIVDVCTMMSNEHQQTLVLALLCNRMFQQRACDKAKGVQPVDGQISGKRVDLEF